MAGPVRQLWQRPGLSPRDRSIVTAAALIARNGTTELPAYLNLAFDNGVKPRELFEIITHLAFNTGIPNATAATAVAKDIFAQHKINANQLPPASPQLLPLDEAGEANRAAYIGQQFGTVAPGLVHYTTDPLLREVWLRPDLSLRDRSLVTISAFRQWAGGAAFGVPEQGNR